MKTEDVGEITKKINPIEIIKLLVEVDKQAAAALIAGLAVAATVPIVRSWEINDTTSLIIVGFVLGGAIVLKVIAAIFGADPAFRLHRIVLGWLLIAIITLPILTMFTSAVMGNVSPFNPVYCQTRFWRDCNDVEEELANERAARRHGSAPATAAAPAALRSTDMRMMSLQAAPDASLRHGRKVLVQFAGLIDRERMRAFNRELARRGWDVPESDKGGQRTQKAAGVNEIRYGDTRDEPSADLLSNDVNDITPSSQRTIVRRDQRIAAGTLEVWVSR